MTADWRDSSASSWGRDANLQDSAHSTHSALVVKKLLLLEGGQRELLAAIARVQAEVCLLHACPPMAKVCTMEAEGCKMAGVYSVKDGMNETKEGTCPKSQSVLSVQSVEAVDACLNTTKGQIAEDQVLSPQARQLHSSKSSKSVYTTEDPQSALARRVSHMSRMADAEAEKISKYLQEQERSLTKNQSISDKLWKWFRPQVLQLHWMWDVVFGLVVIANTLLISLALDGYHTDGWYVSLFFILVFWMELVLKGYFWGWRDLFCGKDMLANMLDACLVTSESIVFLLSLTLHDFNKTWWLPIFRLLRLARVKRIRRALRAAFFRDLLTLVNSFKWGITTLIWCGVFLLFFIWTVAFIFRSFFWGTVSNDEGRDIAWYFHTMPRSMLTVFKCSFGDCNSVGGASLLELTSTDPASLMSLILLMFVSSFGLFNIIAAIFLERTMEYAAERTAMKRQRRLEDDKLWFTNVSRLLTMVQNYMEDSDATMGHKNSLASFRRLRSFRFTKDVLDRIVKEDNEAQLILAQLDIDPEDHIHLPDIADMNNSGIITGSDLILALQRLRGPARHGEIVTVDLMIRSLQMKIDDVWAWSRSASLAAASGNNGFGTLPKATI